MAHEYRDLLAFKHTSSPGLWIFAAHDGVSWYRQRILMMIGVQICGDFEDGAREAKYVTPPMYSTIPLNQQAISAAWDTGVTYPYASTPGQERGYRLGSIQIT